jgi:hypothetical protein
VNTIIDNSKQISTRDQLVENLKKVKRDFKDYYLIYDKMDKIFKKYDEDNETFANKFDEDIYEAIYSRVRLLNDMKIREIYEEVCNNGIDDGDDENENYQQNDNNNDDIMIQLQDHQIIDKKEYYEKREEDLQKVHQIAGKIKDLTQDMAKNLEGQREKLDTIENHVDEAHDNAVEARKQIIKANQTSKKNTKKLCCIIFIIAVALCGLGAIVISVLVNM